MFGFDFFCRISTQKCEIPPKHLDCLGRFFPPRICGLPGPTSQPIRQNASGPRCFHLNRGFLAVALASPSPSPSLSIQSLNSSLPTTLERPGHRSPQTRQIIARLGRHTPDPWSSQLDACSPRCPGRRAPEPQTSRPKLLVSEPQTAGRR
jgi:hypothetical protein